MWRGRDEFSRPQTGSQTWPGACLQDGNRSRPDVRTGSGTLYVPYLPYFCPCCSVRYLYRPVYGAYLQATGYSTVFFVHPRARGNLQNSTSTVLVRNLTEPRLFLPGSTVGVHTPPYIIRVSLLTLPYATMWEFAVHSGGGMFAEHGAVSSLVIST